VSATTDVTQLITELFVRLFMLIGLPVDSVSDIKMAIDDVLSEINIGITAIFTMLTICC
jgi:hypothetical protein